MSLTNFPNRESIPGRNSAKEEAIRSSKWALLSTLSANVAPPLLTLFLAHLLTPEDYGIVGLSIVLISFMRLIQQAGLAQALIQRETDTSAGADADVAFWINLAFALVLYFLIWVSAPVVATFFAEFRIAPVLRVLGLQLLVSAIGIVHSAQMIRRFHFRQLCWLQLASSIAPFVVSIPMAAAGYGYWALIAGLVSGSVINSALLWIFNPWRPQLRFDLAVASQLMRFGGWVLAESFLAWMSLNLDKVIIAKIIGMKALGLYSLAFSIAIMAISIPLSGITSVALPMLSRMQHDITIFKKTYLEGTRLVAVYALPAGAGLALLSGPIVHVVCGDRWTGIETILAILALYSGIGHLWALNSDAYKAIGRPDIMPKIFLSVLLVMAPAIILSAYYGLVAFTAVRSLIVLVGVVPHTYFARQLIGVGRLSVWHASRVAFISCVFMSSAILLVQHAWTWLIHPSLPWTIIGVGVPTGAIAYFGCLFLLDKSLLQSIYHLAKRSFSLP